MAYGGPVSPPTAPAGKEAGNVPGCFAGNVYYDRFHDTQAAKILPGEYYVTGKDMLLVTVLGSCVSACMRDPVAHVGGMNHFMLPDSDSSNPAGSAARYGTFAMEMLINHLLKMGARRDRLEAKLFGGGSVVPGMTMTDVGHRNAEFAVRFLKTEGIRLAASDLADIYPRKLYYFAATGRALVKRLYTVSNDTLLKREKDYSARLQSTDVHGDVELFD